MPEEINRIVTDAISDVLLVTEESGQQNLLREGVGEKKVHLIGNLMIDTLYRAAPSPGLECPGEVRPARATLRSGHHASAEQRR